MAAKENKTFFPEDFLSSHLDCEIKGYGKMIIFLLL
jgi:hypothetical protein